MSLLDDATFPASPYPGLRSFEEHEWPIFFGRERFVENIVGQLARKHVLLVHGDSGAGKSSLIRAGVLPLLTRAQAGGVPWRSVVVRPGRQPLDALADALATGEADARTLRRLLCHGHASAAELARLLDIHDGRPLCLVIDQFEELFESTAEDDGLQALRIAQFLSAVAAPSPMPGFWVVLTMRSEYLGRCASVPGLAELVGENQYLLPRMGREDLLRAVREPASLYGGEVTPGFAAWLVDRTAGNPDQLPLVQHALAYLAAPLLAQAETGVDTAVGWTIPGDAASPLPDPRELLSRHADETFALGIAATKLPEENATRLGDAVLRALTDTNAEGLAIRRPQLFGELVAIARRRAEAPVQNPSSTETIESRVAAFLAPFRSHRHALMTPYGDEPPGPDTRIDISHESLLRNWKRIADPVNGLRVRELEDGLRWKLLLQQAAERQKDESPPLLPPGTARQRKRWMDMLDPVWADRYGGRWNEVATLVDASVRAARRSGRVKVLAGILAVIALLLGAGIVQKSVQNEALSLERQKLKKENEKLTVANSLLADERNQLNEEKRRLQRVVDDFEQQLATEDVAVSDKLEAAVQQVQQQLERVPNPEAKLKMRIYLHIADESQRAGAAHVGELLRGSYLDGQAVRVEQGIERPAIAPESNQLRCFRKEECLGEARALLDLINSRLATPKLVLVDLSRTYEGSSGIRPRHYEIWFAAGAEIRAAEAPRRR